MLSFTKNRDQPRNRQVCLTTPIWIGMTGVSPKTGYTYFKRATYKSEPNHALIRAIVQSRSWVEKLKAGSSVYRHHSIRRHFRRQVVEAYSPGLPITQARHRYFGWHHRSGADHKEAIGQGYPPQLGGPACKVPLLNSLLIRIKFPVNFSTHAQNPNTPCGLARAPIQKQKYSLLISLLIPKNRENPPSPNDLLSKG